MDISPRALIFGQYRLIPSQRLLLQDEAPLPIGSRALDLLIALVEHAGSILSQEQLLASAWPNTSVHEANLRVHIGGIRKLLGAGRGGHRYIVNEAGRGYRFVAPVAFSDEPTLSAPGRSPADGPPVAAEKMRSNLTAIVGRSKIIDALTEQLPKKRLITIVGPGGIGKTTVALAVAERLSRSHEYSACFVDLAPLADPALVYAQLTSSLGVTSLSDNQIPALVAFLQDKQMLIVFDNCERVIDAVTPLAEGIGLGAPHARVLATSREPLRARGEWIQRLAPLTLPEPAAKLSAAEALAFPAIQLFVERAGASHNGFELSDEDVPIVADICRKLDGLPLAIELAAGRIDAFGLRGLARLLDQRFQLSALGRRTAAPRHQTLAATLDWSYETLPDPERVILRRLAIFAGAFTLESASEVASDLEMDASSVVDCVANLVEKSLVAADLSGVNAQYRLLDTTRAYALQKLSESSEFQMLARRHAEYYRALFERAEGEREKQPAEWLGAYRREIDNVRSALDWAFSQTGDQALGVALTLAAIPLWTHLSLNEECRSRVRAALQSIDPSAAAEDRTRMQLYSALGSVLIITGAFDPEMNAACSNALAIAETLGDTDFQLQALWGLWAKRTSREGDFGEVLALGQSFGRVARSSAVAADAFVGERMIGYALHMLGEQDQARLHLERMLARYAPHPSHIARFQFDQRILARSQLSVVLWLQGFPDQAMQSIATNIKEAREGGHLRSLTYALVQSGCPVAIYNGDLRLADQLLKMLLDLNVHDGSLLREKWTRCYQSLLLMKRGDLAVGTNRFRIAQDDFPVNSFHMRYVALVCELAQGLCDDGQVESALASIEKALDLSHRKKELWCMPELLRVRGEIAVKAGAAGAAEDYFHQALDWARRQKALSWELRGATSLARFWREQGRFEDAYGLLAPVYAQFTEGFETSDLKSAKSLLAALQGRPNDGPRDLSRHKESKHASS